MEVLQGKDLAQAWSAGLRCLERYRDTLNALNVYPVPDGDTGTNMLLTMKAGIDRVAQVEGGGVAAVAAGLADGAFWEARGNSGVILSQFFKGLAQGLADKEVCAAADLTAALRAASDAAYRSVGNPVEGTMLTVIRCAAEALESDREKMAAADCLAHWQTALAAARSALDNTPELLPRLKEAGVVDAGGMGIVVILGGAYAHLTGPEGEQWDVGLPTAAGPVDLSQRTAAIESDFLDASTEGEWGYCTQFLIQGDGLDLEKVRADLAETAESLVIVGDDQVIRVHIHIGDPGAALSYGVALGELSQIKIDNMNLQNQDWAAGHQAAQSGNSVSPSGPVSGLALVAVAPGEGLAQLFRDAGCAAVVSGGQTMNPSVAQLVNAAAAAGGREVILLPNNKNVAITATQAAERENEEQQLYVIPTRTVAQGVAAALAFNAQLPAAANRQAMETAVASVVSIEVTRAVRATTLDGVAVAEGDYMGLVEGDLAVVRDSPEAALLSALEGIDLSEDHIVTLYRGAEAAEEAAAAAARSIEEKTPGIQVDLVYGGQPHYPYFAAVE